MKLLSLRIRNFRSCADATVGFGDFTCLVGPNGAGKSTILAALNVFFRNAEEIGVDPSLLAEEDFCMKDTDKPVFITLTFGDLSEQAESELADYVRHGQLVVSSVAMFDQTTRRAEVRQYGERLVMPEFVEYFAALSNKAKKQELFKLYEGIRAKYPTLERPTTIDSMTGNLRNYEEQHKEDCKPVPSEDQFYGFSRGAGRLNKYIQWIYVPAVKDATTEQNESRNSALGKLLERTVRVKTTFDTKIERIRKDALMPMGSSWMSTGPA